jgi:flagellar protein FliS
MFETAASRYTQIRDTTATPGELLLALYDGLFRFMNGARACLQNNDLTRARELLSKAYAITSELYMALDYAASPDLCEKLEGLYGFAMDRITAASRKGDINMLEEAIRVLTPVREAWSVAVPQAHRELAAEGRR